MKFSGLKAIPCQCVKVVQKEDQYKVVIYKERLTAKDSGTWNLTISVKDDQTQPFVKPNEYEQKIQINFKESVVETNTTDAAAESAANETSEADNSTETKEESATEAAVASPTVDVKKVETKKFAVDTKKFKPNFKFNPNKAARKKKKKARLPVILKLKKISRSGKITINFN